MTRRSVSPLALVAAVLGGVASAAGPDCQSLAVFDAACARCHEAECSGRLTFADPSRARDHVLRYAGAGADARVVELIELLRVTKEECRIDPAAALRCGGPPWDAAQLRRVHVGSERAWFVPLGAAAAGPQRVVLRFDRDVGASLRISTLHFEVLHESAGRTRERALEIPFSAPDADLLFLRLRADAVAELLDLRVEPGAPPH
jgi:hypothetical protein